MRKIGNPHHVKPTCFLRVSEQGFAVLELKMLQLWGTLWDTGISPGMADEKTEKDVCV